MITYERYSLRNAEVKTPDGRLFYEGMELKKSEDGMFHCEKCPHASKIKKNLVQHFKYMHLGLSYRKERMFQRLHPRKVVHPEVVKGDDGKWTLNGIQLLKLEDGSWSCGKCGHRVTRKLKMIWHVKTFHFGKGTFRKRRKKKQEKRVLLGPKTLKETYISKTVVTEDGRTLFEGVEIPPVDETKKFKCVKCSRTYSSVQILKNHIKKFHLAEGKVRFMV
jgi:DNA-directed RNA polymerase subunit RPC12/RpoP